MSGSNIRNIGMFPQPINYGLSLLDRNGTAILNYKIALMSSATAATLQSERFNHSDPITPKLIERFTFQVSSIVIIQFKSQFPKFAFVKLFA